jgi:hypothetical protein
MALAFVASMTLLMLSPYAVGVRHAAANRYPASRGREDGTIVAVASTNGCLGYFWSSGPSQPTNKLGWSWIARSALSSRGTQWLPEVKRNRAQTQAELVVLVPWWCIALPCFAIGGAGFVAKRRLPKPGQCERCRYELAGAPICAECGHAAAPGTR